MSELALIESVFGSCVGKLFWKLRYVVNDEKKLEGKSMYTLNGFVVGGRFVHRKDGGTLYSVVCNVSDEYFNGIMVVFLYVVNGELYFEVAHKVCEHLSRNSVYIENEMLPKLKASTLERVAREPLVVRDVDDYCRGYVDAFGFTGTETRYGEEFHFCANQIQYVYLKLMRERIKRDKITQSSLEYYEGCPMTEWFSGDKDMCVYIEIDIRFLQTSFIPYGTPYSEKEAVLCESISDQEAPERVRELNSEIEKYVSERDLFGMLRYTRYVIERYTCVEGFGSEYVSSASVLFKFDEFCDTIRDAFRE